jgi:hypothetical protein
MEHTPTRDAYFAGLLDGEAAFMLFRKPGRAPIPAIEINMTCKATLDALAAYFGGNVRSRKISAISKKPQFRWRAEAMRAREVVTAIHPYVITRREAVERFIAVWSELGLWENASIKD